VLVQNLGQAKVGQLDFGAAVIGIGAMSRNSDALHENILRFDISKQPLHFIAQVNTTNEQLRSKAGHGVVSDKPVNALKGCHQAAHPFPAHRIRHR
jgi:hypothetical protein